MASVSSKIESRGQKHLKSIALASVLVFVLGTGLGFAQQAPVLYTGDLDNLMITDPQGNMNTNGAQNFTEDEVKKMELMFQRYQEEIMNGWESKAIYTQAKLIKSKRDLEKNLEVFSSSDQRIQEYNAVLLPLEQQIQSLQQQLGYLDQQVQLTQYKISNVTEQIITKQEEIKHNMEDVERAKLEVKNQEQILLEYVKLIYDHEQQYHEQGSTVLSDVKLLLADQTISKTITTGEYLQIVQSAGKNILDELKGVYQQLAQKEIDLESKQDRLQVLKRELNAQRLTLQEEQVAKQRLLEVTQGDEQKYQELILQTEQEKEQSAEDIDQLKGSITTIEKELEALRKNAKNLDDATLQKKAESAADLLDVPLTSDNANRFPWPVEPQQGISAYFKDSNYRGIFGVDHGALDIPASQGTEIRAPGDAYVYKAKDNGYGYSYVILAHRDNFLTLYGHVSSILVKEGDVVRKGDVIGLSGGAPGTKGAGWRTTGPHLHMEIWKDGKKVDPLLYMDLTQLPEGKFIPEMLPAEQLDVNLDESTK